MDKTILLIENGTIVCDPLNPVYRPDHSLAICGSEILDVGPRGDLRTRYPHSQTVDIRGAWVFPGLVDAHTHLYAALCTGMPSPKQAPQNFPEILERIWWPLDRALRESDVYLSAMVGGLASLRCGITTLIDHHSSPNCPDGSLSLIAAGLARVGQRACLAFEVTDRNGPALREAGIAENVRFLQETAAADDPLVRGLFGLHAVFSLEDETLERCAELAAGLGAGVHLHVAEHRTEVEAFSRRHTHSIVETLAELGVLGPGSILAHTVHLSDGDIEILRDSGSLNVHNPRSNMGNGVGAAPVAKMLAMGQMVGLGSDGFYDLPQEVNYAGLLATHTAGNPSGFSSGQALSMLYGNNVRFAEGLFGCRLGKLEAGYAADLFTTVYAPFTPVTPGNFSQHVLAALTTGQVRTVLVAGRVALQECVPTGIDEESLRSQACQAAGELWGRMEERG